MWSWLRARIRRFFDAELKEVAVNTLWMWFSTTSRILLGILQIAIVTRYLGADQYGRLAIVMSISGFATMIFAARVWEWVTKFFSDAHAARDADAAGATLKLGLLLSAVTNLVALTTIVISAGPIASGLYDDPSLHLPIVLFAVTLLFAWVNDASSAALRVLGLFRFLAAFGIASTVVRFLALLVALAFGADLVGLVVASVVGEFLVNAMLLAKLAGAFRAYFGRRIWTARLSALSQRRSEIKRMLIFSFGIDTLRSIGTHADVLILGYFRSPASVALYRLAHTFIDIVNRLAMVLVQVAYATLARQASRRDVYGMLRLLRRSSLAVTTVVVPGCALGTLLAPLLVELVSGPGFADAVPVLQVLVWSCLWTVTFWTSSLCMSIGKPSWAFWVSLGSLFVKVALLFPLTWRYGEVGLAWTLVGNSAAFLTLSLLTVARARRFMLSAGFRVLHSTGEDDAAAAETATRIPGSTA